MTEFRKGIRIPKKLTNKEFVEKSIEVHGSRYGYEFAEYKTNKQPVKLICKHHGPFSQLPMNHLVGKGCPFCVKNKKSSKLNLNEFIKRANDVHDGKYDYSRSVFKTTSEKIEIVCKTHGSFHQFAAGHLSGQGCAACAGVKKYTLKDFVNKCRSVHGSRYDYTSCEWKSNNKEKVKIICPRHGAFIQSAMSHLAGASCPRCKRSRGEQIAAMVLDDMGLKYKTEVKLLSCKSIKPLPFDFIVKVSNDDGFLMEFHGEQHYKPTSFNRKIKSESEEVMKKFRGIVLRDEIKKKWCNDRSIRLLIVPYWGVRKIRDAVLAFVDGSNHYDFGKMPEEQEEEKS